MANIFCATNQFHRGFLWWMENKNCSPRHFLSTMVMMTIMVDILPNAVEDDNEAIADDHDANAADNNEADEDDNKDSTDADMIFVKTERFTNKCVNRNNGKFATKQRKFTECV